MPKRIVIFAHGSGDGFTTQDSNARRLYDALDRSQPDQIAYYVDDIGVSSIKALSTIDTLFGLRVPLNIKQVYRFLCRNWAEGDEIFMFGVGRGAFTIRTLIGLIAVEGLVPNTLYGETVTAEEMTRNVNNAWRSYRKRAAPWYRTLPTIWYSRWLRDAFLAMSDILGRNARFMA